MARDPIHQPGKHWSRLFSFDMVPRLRMCRHHRTNKIIDIELFMVTIEPEPSVNTPILCRRAPWLSNCHIRNFYTTRSCACATDSSETAHVVDAARSAMFLDADNVTQFVS